MNVISFEMASCQIFIGSWTPENLRKCNTLLIITLIYALLSWATPSLKELGFHFWGGKGRIASNQVGLYKGYLWDASHGVWATFLFHSLALALYFNLSIHFVFVALQCSHILFVLWLILSCTPLYMHSCTTVCLIISVMFLVWAAIMCTSRGTCGAHRIKFIKLN
jgi:hypothetical protein